MLYGRRHCRAVNWQRHGYIASLASRSIRLNAITTAPIPTAGMIRASADMLTQG